jgi:hypothetical protein
MKTCPMRCATSSAVTVTVPCCASDCGICFVSKTSSSTRSSWMHSFVLCVNAHNRYLLGDACGATASTMENRHHRQVHSKGWPITCHMAVFIRCNSWLRTCHTSRDAVSAYLCKCVADGQLDCRVIRMVSADGDGVVLHAGGRCRAVVVLCTCDSTHVW